MDLSRQLQVCIFFNALLLTVIVVVIFVFDSGDDVYFRGGPSEKLVVISVKISTWERYAWLAVFICFIKISDCIIAEIAHPIIGFNIYNPDKKIIKDFSKGELQFYGNAMYLIDSIKRVFTLIISITQIDLALIGVFAGEFTSLFTIRKLLNAKEFVKDEEAKEVEMEELI